MYLKFKQKVGKYESEEIAEFDDEIARGFINLKQAEASTAGEWFQASLKSEMAAAELRFQAKLDSVMKAGSEQTRSIIGPPGGGANFQHIADGKAAAELERVRFGDILRCIHASQAKGAPEDMRRWATERMQRVYSEDQIEYKVDPATGQFHSIVTRQLIGGGTETITRTGTDSLGGGATYGFTVKPEYLGDLFRIAREQEVFADAARTVPVVQGVEVKYPALDQYQTPTLLNGVPQSAVFAGITLSYLGETATRVSSDGKTNEIDFKIVDMTGATDYSRDYIVDNFIAMDSVITGIFGEAMAWIEDWVTIRGNGLAQPQGYFNANATLSGGGVSGGATRAVTLKIVAEDLGWMLSHLAGQCWSTCRWIAHPSTIPQLFILNNAAGTPVFQPNALMTQADELSIIKGSTSDGRINRQVGLLFNRPIMFTEKVPQLGTTGDISLVCPPHYGLAKRSGIEVGVSEHFYFSTDRIAYRFKLRHDGRSLWRAPYTDTSGATATSIGTGWQTSPFITLAHL